MAGSRKVKIKKSPEPVLTPAVVEDDDELVGDLLAELDSRDQTESANVINEVKQGITDSDRKQDAKTRFNARRASPTYRIKCNFDQRNRAGSKSG
jgi:OTU domain-containing protein 6